MSVELTAAQDFSTQRILYLDSETAVAPNGNVGVCGFFLTINTDLMSEIDEPNRLWKGIAPRRRTRRCSQHR